MHSTIYQISREPIAEHDFLRIDNIVAGEMASISYVCENTDDGRYKLYLGAILGYHI